MATGSSIVQSKRRRPPQRGQAKTSTSKGECLFPATPPRAGPLSSITARVAYYISRMSIWFPPSKSTETLVSLSARLGVRAALKRGWSATLSSFGRPE